MASSPVPASDVVRFGDFTLDLRAGEIWRDGGNRVLLPHQGFRLLAVLVRSPGTLVTREDLRHELWADDTFVDFEHGLNSAIKRLREALGESATAPRYIETLPRRGYRFIAPVVPLNGRDTSASGEVAQETPAPALPVESSATVQATFSSNKRNALRWFAYGLAVTGLIIAGFLATKWQSIRRPRPPIIAVLPFTNLSGETDGDLFVDGLTDEIIRNLAMIQGLQVRSRTSSFAFKDKPRNLREVGDQLGATLVLEGSVLGTSTRKRITAQLVEVADDVPLWAGQFDRDIQSSGDVFVVLDEISRAIVNRLRLTLGRGQRRYDLDLDTYELYLKGRALAARKDVPSLEEAAGLFEQVIVKDPAFAPAHAGLANAYALMSEPTSSQLPFETAHAILRPAAIKARELDPLLAEAHAAMGLDVLTRTGVGEGRAIVSAGH
jgi:TolB-like protein/DNA-binding winged helix-turn-helix (wHTH) protein